ncbi:MAG: adhesin [Bilophila sp.]
MKYRIGDSARLVTSYRGYSLVTIIDYEYEDDRYWVALTSGFKLVVREDELEDV